MQLGEQLNQSDLTFSLIGRWKPVNQFENGRSLNSTLKPVVSYIKVAQSKELRMITKNSLNYPMPEVYMQSSMNITMIINLKKICLEVYL